MWNTIRLELARSVETPLGRPDCGYEITAPVGADGLLQADAWKSDKARAVVRRFWHGMDDERGQLIHTRHRTWAVSYAPGEDDDEPVFRLEAHRLQRGEYVSITEHDGVTRTFQVAAVHPAVRP